MRSSEGGCLHAVHSKRLWLTLRNTASGNQSSKTIDEKENRSRLDARHFLISFLSDDSKFCCQKEFILSNFGSVASAKLHLVRLLNVTNIAFANDLLSMILNVFKDFARMRAIVHCVSRWSLLHSPTVMKIRPFSIVLHIRLQITYSFGIFVELALALRRPIPNRMRISLAYMFPLLWPLPFYSVFWSKIDDQKEQHSREWNRYVDRVSDGSMLEMSFVFVL